MTFTIFKFPYSHFQKNEALESWHNWLLSNWNRLLNWKGPETYPKSSKLFKRTLKITALIYIYQLAKFGDLMSCGSKICSKMHPVLCCNTHRDVTDVVNRVIIKNVRAWVSLKWNITVLGNKNILLNLHLRWRILKSYCLAVEVTFEQ